MQIGYRLEWTQQIGASLASTKDEKTYLLTTKIGIGI